MPTLKDPREILAKISGMPDDSVPDGVMIGIKHLTCAEWRKFLSQITPETKSVSQAVRLFINNAVLPERPMIPVDDTILMIRDITDSLRAAYEASARVLTAIESRLEPQPKKQPIHEVALLGTRDQLAQPESPEGESGGQGSTKRSGPRGNRRS